MRSKTRVVAVLLMAALLLGQAVDRIRWTQIRSGDRRGQATAGNIGQSACGATITGHIGTFDANGCLIDGGAAGSAQLHVISFGSDGGGAVLTTGDIGFYPTVAFACTINRIDISGSPSGSITVDVWKAAGAIPTSGNKISASAPLTLSSAQLAQNGSRTGWTSAVSSGDVFGFNIATVSAITKVTGQIWCQ